MLKKILEKISNEAKCDPAKKTKEIIKAIKKNHGSVRVKDQDGNEFIIDMDSFDTDSADKISGTTKKERKRKKRENK